MRQLIDGAQAGTDLVANPLCVTPALQGGIVDIIAKAAVTVLCYATKADCAKAVVGLAADRLHAGRRSPNR